MTVPDRWSEIAMPYGYFTPMTKYGSKNIHFYISNDSNTYPWQLSSTEIYTAVLSTANSGLFFFFNWD